MGAAVSPKRRYTFWINDAEAEGLKLVKEREDIAESEQVRQAIRDYLRKKGVTKTVRKRATTRKRT